MAAITADKIMQAWADAGIVDDIDTIQRFVVDLQCGHIPIIYIQRIGDDRLLSVAVTLEGIEISRDPDLAEQRQKALDILAAQPPAEEIAAHVAANPI